MSLTDTPYTAVHSRRHRCLKHARESVERQPGFHDTRLLMCDACAGTQLLAPLPHGLHTRFAFTNLDSRAAVLYGPLLMVRSTSGCHGAILHCWINKLGSTGGRAAHVGCNVMLIAPVAGTTMERLLLVSLYAHKVSTISYL